MISTGAVALSATSTGLVRGVMRLLLRSAVNREEGGVATLPRFSARDPARFPWYRCAVRRRLGSRIRRPIR